MNKCQFCDEQHGEWVVLEFNDDFNYGGIFKTREAAEAFIAAHPNRDNDGLQAVARCHWAGELATDEEK